jgi:hypothetical protein
VEITPAADVYGFGVLMVELASCSQHLPGWEQRKGRLTQSPASVSPGYVEEQLLVNEVRGMWAGLGCSACWRDRLGCGGAESPSLCSSAHLFDFKILSDVNKDLKPDQLVACQQLRMRGHLQVGFAASADSCFGLRSPLALAGCSACKHSLQKNALHCKLPYTDSKGAFNFMVLNKRQDTLIFCPCKQL